LPPIGRSVTLPPLVPVPQEPPLAEPVPQQQAMELELEQEQQGPPAGDEAEWEQAQQPEATNPPERPSPAQQQLVPLLVLELGAPKEQASEEPAVAWPETMQDATPGSTRRTVPVQRVQPVMQRWR